METQSCLYKKISSDGYGATWKTSCGQIMQYAAPIEVGMTFPPLPTECGKYCTQCGKLITLKE